MSNEYRLKSLKDEEILKLYELFFGPILMRRETKFYLENLKTFLNKDSSIEKVISRLNVLEIEIIKLLSQLTEVPSAFLNEKLSIILGEHPSLIGKTIQNLIVKNYIFTRDDKYLFIPELIANHYKNEGISAKKISTTELVYNCEKFGDVINTIIYFLSKGIKFSKSGGLYKKDFELLSAAFCAASGYLRDEYDIIGYFFSTSFIYEDEVQIKDIQQYFKLSQLERMLTLVKKVFPYLQPILNQVYDFKTSYKINKNELKYAFKTLLLASVLEKEPYRADFESIIEFLCKIGLCKTEDEDIIFIYYDSSNALPMELKITSNFAVYTNSCNTDCDYYLCALFSEFVKYDKITELEINDISICRAIQNGCDYEQFENFILQHSVNLGANVSTTIKEWFSRHNSFFYVEGTVFFVESPEKGKTISRLIENGTIKAFTVKKDSVFLIPEEEKDLFFSFMLRSNFTFFEKKPSKKPEDKKQIKEPVEYKTFLTFNND